MTGFRSPTAEAGYYPNIVTMAYVLPVPFAPRGFYEMLLEGEPSGMEEIYPEFSPLWDEDVRTTKQDRIALVFSATWTSEEHGALQMMGILVSKGGIIYNIVCHTGQADWDKYEDIFEYICLSITVPQ